VIRLVLIGLAVWLVVSLPFAVLVGRFIKAGRREVIVFDWPEDGTDD